MSRSVLSLVMAFAAALVCVVCLNGVLAFDAGVGFRLLWIVALAALVVGGIKFWQEKDTRLKRAFGVFGGLFVAAQALGLRLETADYSGIAGWLWCIGAGLGAAPAMGYVFIGLYRFLTWIKLGEHANARKEYWLSFAVIFLCWLPVYLAYWPGISAYDIFSQLGEIIDREFTNRNPLLHTLVMGGFYELGGLLGSRALGYSLFILMQMAVMAACFAAVPSYLKSIGVPRGVWITTLVLFAILPIHSMLSISDTKDGFFAAFLALIVIRLHKLFCQPELIRNKRFVAGFLLTCVLMCMMRNNVFAGVVLCMIAIWFGMKEQRKRLCALLLCALVLYFGAMNGLKAAFNASGSLVTELVSVQSQQMSRVYRFYHETEPDDCAEIKAYLPTVEDYKPYTADPVKTFAIVNRTDRMIGFLKLWGRVGLGHPMTYLDAWLMTTKGYWFLGDATHSYIYGEGLEGRLGYLLSGSAEYLGLGIQSKLPALEKMFEELFSANRYRQIPVASLLFAPALYIWLCAFVLVSAIVRRDRRTIALTCLVAGSFLPLLFGACVLIRYVYPFVVCLPLLMSSLISKRSCD